MPNACILRLVAILLFGLLSSLQRVTALEGTSECDSLNCLPGFKCCQSGCCPVGILWEPLNDTFRIVIIILLVIMVFLPLLCLCGLRCVCPCRDPQQNHPMAPEPPSIDNLEGVWLTTLDPPPPYSEVDRIWLPNNQQPTPTEPPPPYSLMPEDQNV